MPQAIARFTMTAPGSFRIGKGRMKSVKPPIILCAFLCLFLPTIPGFGSDTWTGGTASPSWAVGGNWSTGAVPVNGDDVIMLGPGNTTNKTDITFYLNSVQFPSGGPIFHIQVTSAISIGGSLGGGVSNNTGAAQFFDVLAKHVLGDWLYIQGGTIGTGVQITNYGSTISGDDPQSGGNTQFSGTASAGSAVINNNAAEANDTASGKTTFYSQASAGNAVIINYGADGEFLGGSATFNAGSTAGSAAIINEAGTATGASGGSTYFADSSNVANARITNNGSAIPPNATFNSSEGTTFVEGATVGGATILNHGGLAANAYGGYTQIDFSDAGTATITDEAGVSGAFAGRTVFNAQASGGNASIANNGAGGTGTTGGSLTVYNNSTAGNATINNYAAQSTSAFSGETTFNGGSAGTATITNNGSNLAFSGNYAQQGGVTFFQSTATAGSATIVNNGGTAQFTSAGGETIFNDSSTGGSTTLIANAGVPGSGGGGFFIPGGLGGLIAFNGSSTGGKARIELFGNGTLDISFHSLPGLGIGSIEGTGDVFLGANNLSIGSNGRSTIFSGLIENGGMNGGTGGSLTKIGSGGLTLSNANVYTGGTTISKGLLIAKNTTGSATGPGAVRDNGGTLGGTGIIGGAVTIGNGTTSGAILQPGSGTTAGTLTLKHALTFNSFSTYKCVLNRKAIPVAGKVSAPGVTIHTKVPFTFVETGTATLTPGTVFMIINNTTANPISGRFSNLANGTTFTSSSGTTYKANYFGGTGNDLTLTVVP